MSLTSDNLVGYLRAEFEKAAQIRVWLFCVQLLVAVPGAISILVPDDREAILYVLALLGFALLVAWWLVDDWYDRVRAAAQAARRAAMLVGGLGESLSPSELQSLRERFTVTASQALAAEKNDYYATQRTPGPARLGEMLEESALYSEYLQRISSRVMLGVLLLFALSFLVIALAVTPLIGRDTTYIVIRVFLAALVFAMSADVLGAYRAHRDAAKEISYIRHRLTTADRGGYPLQDVLLAFTDYNASVEAAPESVPFAYKLCGSQLNERWETYQSDRVQARAISEKC